MIDASNKRMPMQILIIVVISMILAATTHYAKIVISWLLGFHDWIGSLLGTIFSSTVIGNFIQLSLSFIILPFLVSLVAAAVYSAIKKKFMPAFMLIVWLIWLVMATAIIMMQ